MRPDGSISFGIFLNEELVVETGTEWYGQVLTLFGAPILNNTGGMVFSARFADGGIGILTLDELVAQSGTEVAGKPITGFLSTPVINDSGKVLYHADTGVGVPSPSALFTQDGLVAARGMLIGGRAPVNIVSGTDWNNSGDALFQDVVPFPNFNRALMTQDGVITETGATFAGELITNIHAPSLNDSRQVVFNGGAGIFSFDLVTEEEQLLFPRGTLVDGVAVTLPSNPQLNDEGQLALFAILEGGDRAVVAADETVVRHGDVLEGRVYQSPAGFGLSQNNKGDVGIVVFHTDISGNDKGAIQGCLP